MHTNEGILRAYLDGELNERTGAAVAAHLRECKTCRRQLESLAARVSATSEHLQALAPRGAALPAPAPVALSRLHARMASEFAVRQTTLGGVFTMFQRTFRKYRVAWAGLAAVVVIALLLTLSPVQAAASNFLGLFRVRKFAVISINPASLQSFEQAGGQIDKLLSDNVTFVKQPGEPVTVATADEASQKAGISVRLPSVLTAPKLTVEDGTDAKLKVDAARVQAILNMAGRSDIQLPKALDGATVEFIVPPAVTAQFNCGSPHPMPAPSTGDTQFPKPSVELPAPSAECVTLMQLTSPTVDTPKGVDLAQVGEVMLQLMGLDPAEAKHFASTIDWSSTLVIPMPTNAASFRDVTVDGAQGVLIESRAQSRGQGLRQYLLLWEKNGVVYSLTGWNDPARGIEIANSLK
jgi:hypothetical protein